MLQQANVLQFAIGKIEILCDSVYQDTFRSVSLN